MARVGESSWRARVAHACGALRQRFRKTAPISLSHTEGGVARSFRGAASALAPFPPFSLGAAPRGAAPLHRPELPFLALIPGSVHAPCAFVHRHFWSSRRLPQRLFDTTPGSSRSSASAPRRRPPTAHPCGSRCRPQPRRRPRRHAAGGRAACDRAGGRGGGQDVRPHGVDVRHWPQASAGARLTARWTPSWGPARQKSCAHMRARRLRLRRREQEQRGQCVKIGDTSS